MCKKHERSVKDIDLSKIDLTKHSFVLKAGTELARVMIGNFNPLISTGKVRELNQGEGRDAKGGEDTATPACVLPRFGRCGKPSFKDPFSCNRVSYLVKLY